MLERILLEHFEREFPPWTRNLSTMLLSFEAWLDSALREELIQLSRCERDSLLAPLHQARQQAFRALQHFRDRLSDRILCAFGVPLRTTESEIVITEPAVPDVRVGRVFDRNWELLSPVLPVCLIRS